MILPSAAEWAVSALAESASAVQAELMMFALAAVIYIVFVGAGPQPWFRKAAVKPRKNASPVPARGRLAVGAVPPRAKPRAAAGPDPVKQAAMIKAYGQRRDLAGARAALDTLRASGAQTNIQAHNCFLDACVYCGDEAAASMHFNEMRNLGIANVVGYNIMLKALLAKGSPVEARSLMKEMRSSGLQPNSVTYNELLNAAVTDGDRPAMWATVEEMREAGLPASAVTCSILLKSLTPKSSPWDVRRITKMVDEVVEPLDDVLYCSVVEACVRLCQLDLLSDVIQRYRHNHVLGKLPAPTFGSMIKSYGQAGSIDRVRELWKDMEDFEVTPTEVTLGCVVDAFVTNGFAEEAWELVHQQLEREGRRELINTIIYTTILKGFGVHQIERVFAIYAEMRTNSIPCTVVTYNTMLDACAKGYHMCRAAHLIEDMKEEQVKPDVVTFSTLIKGYVAEGDVDKALSILSDMNSTCAPDEIVYNSVLDGCAKQRRVDDALCIFDEMRATGIRPSNYTLSILVKLLGNVRRLDHAFRLVEDLSSQHGFRPNIQVYTCLVQACVTNRRFDRIFAIYDAAVADGVCRIDQKFYAVLIRSCMQMHQPLKAVEVVRAAYGLPCQQLRKPPRQSQAGLEARALEDIAAQLRRGNSEERRALSELSHALWDVWGVRMDAGRPAGDRASR